MAKFTYVRGENRIDINGNQLSSLLLGEFFKWATKNENLLVAFGSSGLILNINSPVGIDVTIIDRGEEFEVPIAY